MTDETAFQAMLDDDPTNSGCRLVLADWLEDHGDWRAAGYRWMGENKKWPLQTKRSWIGADPPWWRWVDKEHYDRADPNADYSGTNARITCLLLRRITKCDDNWENDHILYPMRSFRTRRAAELALCLALTPTCRRCNGSGRIKYEETPDDDGGQYTCGHCGGVSGMYGCGIGLNGEPVCERMPCPDCAERLVTA